MYPEFEEKEYEMALNNELATNYSLWSPGQVFEQYVGIDTMALVTNQSFWNFIGYPTRLPGVFLDHFNWGYIWRKRGKKKTFPDFRSNLFLQMKRAEYTLYNNPKYQRIGITTPRYFYSIKIHQQKVVEKFVRKLGKKRVLASYAAPTFYHSRDLYNFIRTQNLYRNSNFVNIEKLSGHSKWMFCNPGSGGIALSDPEFIEEESFDKQLERLLLENKKYSQERRDIKYQLRVLSDEIKKICREESKDGNSVAKEFRRRTKALNNLKININQFDHYYGEEVLDMMRISIFCDLFNLYWHVVAE